MRFMDNDTSLLARSFLADWSRHHDGRQPMGWVLRDHGPPAWIRFHALPESKRYAETEDEMAIILARANTLANELLGSESDCWVICARSDEIVGSGDFAWSWIEDASDPYDAVWRYYVRKDIWKEGRYDKAITEIANDAPYCFILFAPESGRVFAPYDGGFDLFAESLDAIENLILKHSDWLSDREDGL